MSEELAVWMEARGIGQMLQAWVNNDLLAGRDYAVLEDLMTTNVAAIKVSLTTQGLLKVAKASTYEFEAAKCERELNEAKKTIKNLEKTVNSLSETQAEAAVAETSEALEPKVRKVRRA